MIDICGVRMSIDMSIDISWTVWMRLKAVMLTVIGYCKISKKFSRNIQFVYIHYILV